MKLLKLLKQRKLYYMKCAGIIFGVSLVIFGIVFLLSADSRKLNAALQDSDYFLQSTTLEDSLVNRVIMLDLGSMPLGVRQEEEYRKTLVGLASRGWTIWKQEQDLIILIKKR